MGRVVLMAKVVQVRISANLERHSGKLCGAESLQLFKKVPIAKIINRN
jgi:hypothetical protein